MMQKLILIGLPTSGKTLTAHSLSQALHLSMADTDAMIERKYAKPISWIFQEIGEEGFRALEYQVVAEALEEPAGIVSLGGGAPAYPPTRRLLKGHRIYYLNATPDFLAQRRKEFLAECSNPPDSLSRPLLQGDFLPQMRQLYEARHGIYENLATAVIDAQQPLQALVDDIVAIERDLGERILVGHSHPYPVIIESNPSTSLSAGVSRQLLNLMPPQTHKALILAAPQVRNLAQGVANMLPTFKNLSTQVLTLPDGEAAKQLTNLASIWDTAANFALERQDLIICIGGGATTDLGGFVAATWLRGVNLIQIPTTLLAMVDAAIGGKTGIDLFSGKNLVGSFYSPLGVVVDLRALRTLPESRMREGLAEILKCGYIRDREILRVFSSAGDTLLNPDSPGLSELVRRALRVKAEIVSQDFYESGIREYLNFGHTLAHGIERCENYRFAHGLAVSIGMMFAANLGFLLGVTPASIVRSLKLELETLGLPSTYREHSFSQLKPLLYSDKKVRDGVLRFVILRDIGDPTVVPVSDDRVLDEAAKLTGIPLE